MDTTLAGLSQSEVQERQAQGETNAASFRAGRSVWDIVRANLFNLFSNTLYTIGFALIALGQYYDALTSVGLALVNALIGTVQELRAKRQLDRISLLTRSAVTVVRAGVEQQIDPAEIVRGDLLCVTAGDQILVDGPMVGAGQLELDESLLTGEPDLVRKHAGDRLRSGSFCVTGTAYYRAELVGNASYANQLTSTVRTFQLSRTPLQRQVALVVRLVTFVVAMMSGVILLQALVEDFPFVRIVQISAVLSGQIPYGLFFLIALTYAVGAARIAREGGLVQHVNAVESLSHVDVLCMDKTGTLTANRLQLHALHPLGPLDEAAVGVALGSFARSAGTGNATSSALEAALPGSAYTPVATIPFASARKWSAMALDAPEQPGVYALGAAERLTPYLDAATDAHATFTQQAAAWADAGLRVLLFAYNPAARTLPDAANGNPTLPPLTPLALVALADELRPQVREVIAASRELGIDLKVISGDNPHTVAALARQAGFPEDLHLISGPELKELSPADFAQTVVATSIFGRVAPEQKEQIVAALCSQGRYVAMLGDGVNDALALKRAQVGIAMESGSSVTRNVADMVLLRDSFAALLPAIAEGRRIIAGLSMALYLFLTRAVTSMLIIIAVSMIGLGFPYEPAQVALTLFTVGLPTLLLARWARPEPPEPGLLRRLFYFVIPAASVTTAFGVAVYTFFYTLILTTANNFTLPPRAADRWEAYTGLDYRIDAGFSEAAATIVAQTALSSFVSLAAFGLILFIVPPHPFFAGWTTPGPHPDRRPAMLALALALIYLFVVRVPTLASYFGLVTPGGPEPLMLLLTLPLWFFTLRTIWRAKLFERLLDAG
ncbi:MAG: HAD family hydrolase [Candidatus Viridilinea halotolerans]|uniref:HAD family hydrolase n=1 Tax=Candidatus Viridilinea halotolerans TaxID=2491704 RepID=A0A426TR21_9CHLR|nr:MAG: HAD family hydrolase [Candidatus Viridilinea halotolerans]